MLWSRYAIVTMCLIILVTMGLFGGHFGIKGNYAESFTSVEDKNEEPQYHNFWDWWVNQDDELYEDYDVETKKTSASAVEYVMDLLLFQIEAPVIIQMFVSLLLFLLGFNVYTAIRGND